MNSMYRICLPLLAAACLLPLLPMTGRARDGVPLFTADFPPSEFADRRAKIYDAIGAGGLAPVQGAPSPSGYVRFR